MKHLNSKLCFLLGALIVSSAQAQTATNIPAPMGLSSSTLTNLPVSTNALKVANDVFQYLEPILPFLTNKDVILDLAPVVTSGGKWGGIGDLQIPINNTLSLGTGAAYLDNEWYATLISTKVGASFTIPVINRPCYAFAETGAAIPVNNPRLDNQTVAGAFTTFDISKSVKFNLEGGVGKETSVPGEFFFFGGSVNWSF